MPYKIVLNCFHRETEIVGNSPLVSNDAKVLEFLTVLENLHQALPLKSFDLKQKGDANFATFGAYGADNDFDLSSL